MVDTVAFKRPLGGLEESALAPRKRFKASDLPLNSTQRSTIDGLLHTIKKKGIYDTLRKQVWSQYAESVSCKKYGIYSRKMNFMFESLC